MRSCQTLALPSQRASGCGLWTNAAAVAMLRREAQGRDTKEPLGGPRGRAHFVEFLSVLCHCNGSPIRANQAVIMKLLVQAEVPSSSCLPR